MAEPLPFGLPAAEAVRAFERRTGRTVTFDWHEMMHGEHARSFTVAKLDDLALLERVYRAAGGAQTEGRTFQQFVAELEPEMRRAGWWGKAERVDPKTGKARIVQLGSERRLRIIFDTNLRVSAAVGQWERITRVADRRPWLRYVGVLDSRIREAHRAWHGTVLRWDHAWWNTHYPPNGWRCRCTVQQLSDRDLDRLGITPTAPAPSGPDRAWFNPSSGANEFIPYGIDPGWAYHVGKAGFEAPARRLLVDRMVTLPTPIAAGAAMGPVWRAALPQLAADTAAWVDAIAAGRFGEGADRRVVGMINPTVLGKLADAGIHPQSAAITISTREIAHILRDSKAAAGKGIALEDMRRLVEHLAAPAAVLLDLGTGDVLYVVEPRAVSSAPGKASVPDARAAKLVVRVDFQTHQRDPSAGRQPVVTNAIRTAGLVSYRNLMDTNSYAALEPEEGLRPPGGTPPSP